MRGIICAQQLMSTKVVSVRDNASLLDALRLMLSHEVSGLPVTDAGGQLTGMLTEGDLLRRHELSTEPEAPWWRTLVVGSGSSARGYIHSHARTVFFVMSRNVITVERRASLQTVVMLMEKHRIKRLPVVDEGRVVGMVSRRDVLKKLAELMSRVQLDSEDDGTIGAAIEAELHKLSWCPRHNFSVTVAAGKVRLSGLITDPDQRAAIHVAVENVPGVRSVEDQLVLMNPYSGDIVLDALNRLPLANGSADSASEER